MMHIAVICIQYGFYASPVTKGICSYLAEQGVVLDVFTNSEKEIYPLNIVQTQIINIKAKLGSVDLKSFLKGRLEPYQWIICVDYFSLDLVASVKKDLSNVIYLSLEGVQIMNCYKKRIGCDAGVMFSL